MDSAKSNTLIIVLLKYNKHCILINSIMSLKVIASKIKTNWREHILNLLNLYPIIQSTYDKESANYTIYPPIENIFRCFNYFNIEETRVVILGQDPYHGPEQANGLCFAVNENIKMPPSLKNIMKKLNDPIADKTLEQWAQQGVLLLNSALTVKEKTPGSHIRLWSNFTTHLLNLIAEFTKNVVFVCWGGFAYNKFAKIELNDFQNNHSIVVCSHPSPLGCSKKLREFPSFNEFNTFYRVNMILGEENAIIW